MNTKLFVRTEVRQRCTSGLYDAIKNQDVVTAKDKYDVIINSLVDITCHVYDRFTDDIKKYNSPETDAIIMHTFGIAICGTASELITCVCIATDTSAETFNQDFHNALLKHDDMKPELIQRILDELHTNAPSMIEDKAKEIEGGEDMIKFMRDMNALAKLIDAI